jgi:hypothetical protein
MHLDISGYVESWTDSEPPGPGFHDAFIHKLSSVKTDGLKFKLKD